MAAEVACSYFFFQFLRIGLTKAKVITPLCKLFKSPNCLDMERLLNGLQILAKIVVLIFIADIIYGIMIVFKELGSVYWNPLPIFFIISMLIALKWPGIGGLLCLIPPIHALAYLFTNRILADSQFVILIPHTFLQFIPAVLFLLIWVLKRRAESMLLSSTLPFERSR